MVAIVSRVHFSICAVKMRYFLSICGMFVTATRVQAVDHLSVGPTNSKDCQQAQSNVPSTVASPANMEGENNCMSVIEDISPMSTGKDHSGETTMGQECVSPTSGVTSSLLQHPDVASADPEFISELRLSPNLHGDGNIEGSGAAMSTDHQNTILGSSNQPICFLDGVNNHVRTGGVDNLGKVDDSMYTNGAMGVPWMGGKYDLPDLFPPTFESHDLPIRSRGSMQTLKRRRNQEGDAFHVPNSHVLGSLLGTTRRQMNTGSGSDNEEDEMDSPNGIALQDPTGMATLGLHTDDYTEEGSTVSEATTQVLEQSFAHLNVNTNMDELKSLTQRTMELLKPVGSAEEVKQNPQVVKERLESLQKLFILREVVNSKRLVEEKKKKEQAIMREEKSREREILFRNSILGKSGKGKGKGRGSMINVSNGGKGGSQATSSTMPPAPVPPNLMKDHVDAFPQAWTAEAQQKQSLESQTMYIQMLAKKAAKSNEYQRDNSLDGPDRYGH